MDKTYRRFDEKSPEYDRSFWRRVELSDLPILKEMVTEQSREMFIFSDIARLITDNPLSLCRVNSKEDILMFVSLSNRPIDSCVAHEHWTEWFNYFYDLPNVGERNTAFVHLILFQAEENLIHVPVMLDTVYVQMPDVNNIVLVKLPGTELCAKMCLPFSVLSAKNVTPDPEFGRPEILYHTRPSSSVERNGLRIAEEDDFYYLKAALGNRLDFLDSVYGENCLADILKSPGCEGRVNLVPTIKANGFVMVNTNVDYSRLDVVFDFRRYTGLIVAVRHNETELESVISHSLLDISKSDEKDKTTDNMIYRLNVEDQYETMSFEDGAENIEPSSQICASYDRDSISDSTESSWTSDNNSSNDRDISLKKKCDITRNNKIKDFLRYQEKPLKTERNDSLNEFSVKLNYQNTAFAVELMLINDVDEDKASWSYLIACFHNFPGYSYCLATIQTIETPPSFKKFFSKISLKPDHHYARGQLYVLHRSFLFGKFTCFMVTKEHLEVMEHLIENHPNKRVISENISKSVFEDTTYKTYIFHCDNQPIGYCVIRLNDEVQFLSSNFDVARYSYTELAHNHMAVLLNMYLQDIFVKKTRYLLRHVMEESKLNCLFYKLYSNSTTMEQYETTDITGMRELIPVKPRLRIQNDDDNVSNDYEKFALFHLNMRLCTIQQLTVDARIVVIGASAVALSFLEHLLFNPVNHCVSFENIVLVSDGGIPYKVRPTDLEDCMVPKTAHFDHEYMKSIGLNTFVDVITGTVTGINRADKCVTVDESYLVYYDYLFLFNGKQFKYGIDDNKRKSDKKKNIYSSISSLSIKPNNENCTLENVFLLNSEKEVTYAFNYIERMKENDRDIVVYGKYLGSLSVINVLLECNIDGSRIVYVESEGDLPFITSQSIVNKVYGELRKQRVRVYKHYSFEKLKRNKNRTKVRKVTFISNTAPLTITCAGMFWFDQKCINEVSRHTFIQSSFKLDGHVLVNESFETNVEFVFAAGPVAKFIHDDSSDAASIHTCYSSVEIGERVADAFTKRLDAIENDGSGRTNATKYVRPLSIRCRLPGKHGYFRCAVPGLTVSMQQRSVKTLRTESAANGYFEMVVDDKDDVLELSCYSNRDFKHSNLTNLCGKNVNLFNDMIDRLSTNSIPCFFDYFNESWAYPLYSDRFWKLLDTIMVRVKNGDEKIKHFSCDNVATLMSEYDANTVLELSAHLGLDRRHEEIYGKELQQILIDFIDENVDDFPVFSHVRDAVDRQTRVTNNNNLV